MAAAKFNQKLLLKAGERGKNGIISIKKNQIWKVNGVLH